MAFKLYNAPQSTCSQRVRFVFNGKKIPFDEVKLNLLAGDQLKPDYLKLNPNGVVPTLDHDGAIVIDSTVITEYLDEVAPQDSFTPETPVERARMRALMHFIDEMPAAAVRVPTFNLAFLPSFQKMSREDFVAMAESKPLRREFMLTMGQTGFPQAEMDAALDAPAPHLRAHGRRDRKERRAVAIGQEHHARRRGGDAGAGAHGRPRHARLAGPAAHCHLVRQHPRASGLQADLLPRLLAERALPAFEGKDGGVRLNLLPSGRDQGMQRL